MRGGRLQPRFPGGPTPEHVIDCSGRTAMIILPWRSPILMNAHVRRYSWRPTAAAAARLTAAAQRPALRWTPAAPSAATAAAADALQRPRGCTRRTAVALTTAPARCAVQTAGRCATKTRMMSDIWHICAQRHQACGLHDEAAWCMMQHCLIA